ncbi:MAG: metal-dependent transcriptional regulator [FCB group bacterium]|nr:metal-dependent transcriptional regulator [FCB group bacterium]
MFILKTGIMHYEKTVQEYVEIIAELLNDHPVARVKEIAAARGVTLPTVTSALEKLKDLKLVEKEHYGFVTLTPEGQRLADELRVIHHTFKKLFTDVLGVDEKIAETDACNLEHHISPQTQNALVKFVAFLESCPRGSKEILDIYHDCYLYTGSVEECGECSSEVLETLKNYSITGNGITNDEND